MVHTIHCPEVSEAHWSSCKWQFSPPIAHCCFLSAALLFAGAIRLKRANVCNRSSGRWSSVEESRELPSRDLDVLSLLSLSCCLILSGRCLWPFAILLTIIIINWALKIHTPSDGLTERAFVICSIMRHLSPPSLQWTWQIPSVVSLSVVLH